MKIVNIKYMKRKNLGNYEHEEVTVEAVVAEGDSAEAAMASLIEFTETALGMRNAVAPKSDLKTVQLSKEGEPNATAQMSPDSTYPAAKEEPSKPASKPRAARTKPEPTDKSDGPGVEQEKPKAAAPVKEDKNVVVFDNTQKPHRVRVATYLNTAHPKWKTLNKEVIVAFTEKINGVPFEDAKAELLPSFKEAVKQHLPLEAL